MSAIATGSLTPVSASSVRASRRRMCVNRSVAKTAAASVEATTAPSSTASSHERSNRVVRRDVLSSIVDATTPTVASRVAGSATLRSLRHDVERPPSKRMAASPTTPTVRASSASSNSIPPGPSEPSSIPSAEKGDQRWNAYPRGAECDEDAPGQDRADHEQHRSDVHARIFTGKRLGRASVPPRLPALRSSGDA